jgi:hypothetical protein
VIRIGGLTFALLGLSLLTFGVVADRALVEQGKVARQAAVTAANEVAAPHGLLGACGPGGDRGGRARGPAGRGRPRGDARYPARAVRAVPGGSPLLAAAAS